MFIANRRLLTARPMSTSAADISSTPVTASAVDDNGSVGDRNSGIIEENTGSLQRTRYTVLYNIFLSCQWFVYIYLHTYHNYRWGPCKEKPLNSNFLGNWMIEFKCSLKLSTWLRSVQFIHPYPIYDTSYCNSCRQTCYNYLAWDSLFFPR